jgi:hypothetical protein
MASGGEAHHADAVGANVEFGGVRANEANGALRVAEFDGMVIARAEAIGKNEGCDPERVELVRDLTLLVIRREELIGTARRANDGRPGHVLAPRRKILERRLIGLGGAERAASAVLPEQNLPRLLDRRKAPLLRAAKPGKTEAAERQRAKSNTTKQGRVFIARLKRLHRGDQRLYFGNQSTRIQPQDLRRLTEGE